VYNRQCRVVSLLICLEWVWILSANHSKTYVALGFDWNVESFITHISSVLAYYWCKIDQDSVHAAFSYSTWLFGCICRYKAHDATLILRRYWRIFRSMESLTSSLFTLVKVGSVVFKWWLLRDALSVQTHWHE
jgi:hypothetical protein